MGQLKFKMKMRLPISESIQWMYQKIKMQLGYDPSEQINESIVSQHKKLHFRIIHGSYAQNVRSSDHTFVYFTLDNKDYHSNLVKGKVPTYEYTMNIDLNLNQQMERFMKTQKLEIYVINDTTMEEDNLVGTVLVDLKELLNNVQIVENIFPVMK